MKNSRGSSILELICSITLILSLTVFIMQTSFASGRFLKRSSTLIKLKYEMQNFSDFIYTDIKKKNARIVKNEKDSAIIIYKIYSMYDYMKKDKCLHTKKIIYDKYFDKIYLKTDDKKNVLLLNVKSAKRVYENDCIKIMIELEKDNVSLKKTIKFKIK